jgi:hypothetical protein
VKSKSILTQVIPRACARKGNNPPLQSEKVKPANVLPSIMSVRVPYTLSDLSKIQFKLKSKRELTRVERALPSIFSNVLRESIAARHKMSLQILF